MGGNPVIIKAARGQATAMEQYQYDNELYCCIPDMDPEDINVQVDDEPSVVYNDILLGKSKHSEQPFINKLHVQCRRCLKVIRAVELNDCHCPNCGKSLNLSAGVVFEGTISNESLDRGKSISSNYFLNLFYKYVTHVVRASIDAGGGVFIVRLPLTEFPNASSIEPIRKLGYKIELAEDRSHWIIEF